MRFRVTNQYSKGPEDVLAEFKNQADAVSFITTKVNDDNAMKIRVIYRLYDSFDLVKEYDSNDVTATDTSSSNAQSGSVGKSSNFRPTPLSTSPTPPGLPKKWWKDEDEEDKK